MQPAPRRPPRPAPPPPDTAAADLEQARRPLRWAPDEASRRYLDAHRADAIAARDILGLLRVDPKLIELPVVPQAIEQAVQAIAMPAWARCVAVPELAPIAQLPPDPRLLELARQVITADSKPVVPWAATVRSRAAPPAPDGSVAKVDAKAKGVHPPPPPRRKKPKTEPRPPPRVQAVGAPPAAAEPSARDDRSWGPHKAYEPDDDTGATAEPTTATGASVATRIGLFGCLAKLVGLCAVLLAAWIGADAAMGTWAAHVDELADELRGRQLLPQGGLDWLVSLGPKDAPVTAVLACDPTGVACRPALGVLLAWLEADHDGPARRLVVLPVKGNGGADHAVEGLYALLIQGRAQEVLRKVAADARPFDLGRVRWLVGEVAADARRWERDRRDEDVQQWQRLQVLTAHGLGMLTDPGDQVAVKVAGLSVGNEDIERTGRLEPAVLAIEQKLAVTAAVMGGDLRKAQAALTAERPARERQRWQAWIVEGRRLGNGH